MIQNAYSDIAIKDEDRKSLSDAVAGFLAAGGKVTDLCPPAPKCPDKPEPQRSCSLAPPEPEHAENSRRMSVREEMHDIRARAVELHRSIDWVEQELRKRADSPSGDQQP